MRHTRHLALGLLLVFLAGCGSSSDIAVPDGVDGKLYKRCVEFTRQAITDEIESGEKADETHPVYVECNRMIEEHPAIEDEADQAVLDGLKPEVRAELERQMNAGREASEQFSRIGEDLEDPSQQSR